LRLIQCLFCDKEKNELFWMPYAHSKYRHGDLPQILLELLLTESSVLSGALLRYLRSIGVQFAAVALGRTGVTQERTRRLFMGAVSETPFSPTRGGCPLDLPLAEKNRYAALWGTASLLWTNKMTTQHLNLLPITERKRQ
jgi:hypothetical protein